MRRGLPTWLVGLVLGLTISCSPVEEQALPSGPIDVACARCVFEMPGAEGCPWAAEVEGTAYMLFGPVPIDHQSHAPDGICNMRRKAVLEGSIRRGNVVATSIQLLPAENIPENPRFTPDIIH